MGNTYAGANTALQAVTGGTITFALYSDVPSLEGGGTEISGAGYARQSLTFSAPADGSTSNDIAVQFPQALEDWGTVVAWALFDGSGTMRRFGVFSEPKTLGIGDFVAIRLGNLTLREYGG